MAVTRSIETRIMEGIRRDFLADTDIAAYFHGRVYVGPLFDNPNTITPPQINISLLSGDVYEAGTGEATKDHIPVLVKCYFPQVQEGLPVGVLNDQDYVMHLQMIIARGSVDPYSGVTNDSGYVLDPDYVMPEIPPVPADPLRWLNTAWHGCTKEAAVGKPGAAILVIPFAIDYETRINTLTRQRV